MHCLRAFSSVVALSAFWAVTTLASPTSAQTTVAEAEALVSDPFFTRSTFSIARTLYVAVNEPGASNSNNGKFPTYRGGLDGPFKDLNATVLRQALANTNNGLRVYIRAGTYRAPDGGLRIRGGGTAATPIIVAGYPGDARPIVDGGECLPFDKVLAIAAGEQAYTPKVESTIKLDGRYGIVEDLQIHCGFRYNVFARGLHNIIRRNIIRGAYEDSIKNTAGADYGLLADNDIAGFVSQGLDHFGANHWLVTRNVIHDPGLDPNSGIVVGNGITVKGAARNVVITRNTVRRFLTNPDQGAITLGAPAALDLMPLDGSGNVVAAAQDAIAMGNTVEEFTGAAFSVQACKNCVVSANTVDRTLGVLKIGIAEETRNESLDSALLPYSSGLIARSNNARFTTVDCGGSLYLGQSCYAIFVVNSQETVGMTMTQNTYYSDDMPFFVYDWGMMDLKGLQTLTGAEVASTITPLALWP